MMHVTSKADPEVLAREVARLRRAVEELSVLNDLACTIGCSSDAGAVMDTIVRRSLGAVGAEQGVITLVDEDNRTQARTLVRTGADSAEQRPLHVDDNLLGWMHHHRSSLVANDPAHDPRFRGVAWDASIRSVLCVPLMVRSRLIGILAVFNKRGDAPFTDGDQRLLSIIASQSAQIIENARLLEEERALLRMQEEVQVARTIQARLLPSESPPVDGYELAGLSRPAQEVGGDYFDFIPLGDGRLGLAVGDVVGKGLPASLLMANVQATLRALAPVADSVEACLTRAGELLHQSTDAGTFVTLFYGALDAQRHAFTYANAGHNPPFLVRRGQPPVLLAKGGLMLGGVRHFAYRADALRFEPGDLLLVYSDGVVEAMDARRQAFEEGRLAALLHAHAEAPAPALLARIEQAVYAHMGDAPQSDDLTLLALRRTR